ncbi:clock-controlled pheromone ccg-4 [Colletotrichum acutatum]
MDDFVVDCDSPQSSALNELAIVVASSQDNQFFYYGGLDLGSHFADDTPETETETGSHRAVEVKGVCRDRKIHLIAGWMRDVETGGGDGVHPGERRWCKRPGASCAIARRAAEALLDVIEGDVVDREEREGDDQTVEAVTFCTGNDQDCWTRSADPARKAFRDLKAMKAAATVLPEAVA